MTVRTPDQIKYSRELIQQYQVMKSYFRGFVNTEGNVQAKTFTWSIGQVAGEAQKRGANGLFVPGDDVNTQASVQLDEYGSLRRNTEFNVFTAPTNVRTQMQALNIAETNKTTDRLIVNALSGATQVPFTTTGSVITLNKVLECNNILDQNAVPDTDRAWFVSPKFFNRLMLIPQFTSRNYVTDEPYMKKMEARVYNGTTYIKHPGLPGVGTASAYSYLFHKEAIGHALVMGEENVDSDFNREQKYFWANATSMQGAKLLLPAGVVAFVHDDSVAI